MDEQLTPKELLILSEIGLEEHTATQFVGYMAGYFAVSESGIWYSLKKLKEKKLLDFAEKKERGKPLLLTELGKSIIRKRRVEEKPFISMLS